MSEVQFNCLPLYGRRIFLVEEDDALYCTIKTVLQDAGAEIIGSLAHFPDMSLMIPAIRIDAAVVDVDDEDAQLLKLTRQLKIRDIPTLLISSVRVSGKTPLVRGQQHFHKPFKRQELIDSVVDVVSLAAPLIPPQPTPPQPARMP